MRFDKLGLFVGCTDSVKENECEKFCCEILAAYLTNPSLEVAEESVGDNARIKAKAKPRRTKRRFRMSGNSCGESRIKGILRRYAFALDLSGAFARFTFAEISQVFVGVDSSIVLIAPNNLEPISSN
ncbi:MAG TPA: hypothetical protein VJN71_04755 [Nitrososphaerales archaeon]|nr:hypothetical protein [Nitrososphaerales archaeon]